MTDTTSISRRAFTVGCAVLPALMLPVSADAQPALRFVRRNIYELLAQNHPTIAAYARAVAAMMKKPIDNPTSWWFQANIHDYPGRDTGEPDPLTAPSRLQYFNKCPHGNFHFLPWHRWYLYYFERIVRKESGDPTFALPYWNYAKAGESDLPQPFRWFDADPQAPVPPLERSNPLARARRHQLIDQALFGLGESATSATAALALPNFLPAGVEPSFGGFGSSDVKQSVVPGALEGQPHDIVHGLVGIGDNDMASTQTAARDPIFWLHHAQIDRLWTEWAAAGEGHAHPCDNAAFMDTPYTFFDESGKEVQHTAREALDNQLGLNYRYDTEEKRDSPLPSACPIKVAQLQSPSASRAPSPRTAGTVIGRGDRVVLGARAVSLPLALAPAAGAAPSPDGPRHTLLLLNDIAVHGSFNSYYEIYLGVPAQAKLEPSGPYFVGTLAFFSAQHGAAHGPVSRSYDVTKVMSGLSGDQANTLTVTFVQKGLVGRSGEFLQEEKNQPTIKSVDLIRQ